MRELDKTKVNVISVIHFVGVYFVESSLFGKIYFLGKRIWVKQDLLTGKCYQKLFIC